MENRNVSPRAALELAGLIVICTAVCAVFAAITQYDPGFHFSIYHEKAGCGSLAERYQTARCLKPMELSTR